MALRGNFKIIRNVNWLKSDLRKEMCTYLQGMVYAWCATKGKQTFAARDILGGVNFNWRNTPLQPLYEHYHRRGYPDDKAINLAGRAAGWLLMKVLADDHRVFKTYKDYVRKYEWVK